MEEIRGNLVSTVHALSEEIGARSWREGERLSLAAGWIEERLRFLGLDVKRQPFSYKGRRFENLHAEIKGASDEVLVVGAHYDTVEGSPGADDNASGVAGLIELARLLSKGSPPPLTLRFAAFCLEEPPAFGSSRMGSAVYARGVRQEGARLRGMVSLEMIGYYCDRKGCQYYPFPFFKLRYPSTGNFVAFVGNRSSRAFTHEMKEGFRAGTSLPVASLNTVRLVPGVDFSDHRSFWDEGFEAFMVTDTAFYRNPHYHGPGDLPATLDFTRMAEVVKGLIRAIRGLSPRWARKA